MSTSDWIALAAIVVSGLIALGTLWWTDRRSRDADDRAGRLEAAATLGPVLVLLVDAHPLRWGITGGDADTQERRVDLKLKLDSVRREINVIAASHPEQQIRDAAAALDAAVYSTVVSSLWLAHPNPPGGSVRALTRANDDHAAAAAAAARLGEVLRPKQRPRHWWSGPNTGTQ